jgi:hypothetical protein
MFAFATQAPVEVASGATSEPVAFRELISREDSSIRLRVAVLGAPAAPPTFTVQTANSPPLTVTADFQPLPDSAGNTIAEVATAEEGDGTHRVRIFVTQPGQEWTMRITNRESSARRYLVVVADNPDQTRQPCIDVPATLQLATTLGQPAVAPYPVSNLGTGPLRLGAQSPPAGHMVTGAPATIALNTTTELTLIVTPTTTGTTTAVLTVASDDPGPADTPGHNHTTRIMTVTTAAVPAFAAPGQQFDTLHEVPNGVFTVNGSNLGTVRTVTFLRTPSLETAVNAQEITPVDDAHLKVKVPATLPPGSRHRIRLSGDFGAVTSDDTLTIDRP